MNKQMLKDDIKLFVEEKHQYVLQEMQVHSTITRKSMLRFTVYVINFGSKEVIYGHNQKQFNMNAPTVITGSINTV